MEFGVMSERICASLPPKPKAASGWGRYATESKSVLTWCRLAVMARTSCSRHLWEPSAQRMSRGGILHALV
jgi:hypothetical protein